eukprot:gnl/MRDRNA2_/MRDRNA2_105629_c0_seq1.p1 gnl/MRDRNA2_/MRDRNA2_105629_c0~~gnl/MRDRNA2_/MRDRNA2_105629_c0_seq1.p1  ORF type:complete len:156 (+),score=27.55 gnl/MRDRNA2_/MRDRNA2_105629_c0_seq1:77-544(+)
MGQCQEKACQCNKVLPGPMDGTWSIEAKIHKENTPAGEEEVRQFSVTIDHDKDVKLEGDHTGKLFQIHYIEKNSSIQCNVIFDQHPDVEFHMSGNYRALHFKDVDSCKTVVRPANHQHDSDHGLAHWHWKKVQPQAMPAEGAVQPVSKSQPAQSK